MFKELDYKIVVGMVIVAVLLVGGTYYFSQRSLNRFASEIGATHKKTIPTKPVPESDTSTPSEKSKHRPDNENKKVEPNLAVESDSSNTAEGKKVTEEKIEMSELVSEFDAASLVSAFGIPDEVKSLLDENAEEADFEKAQEQLTEKYGQSPEVTAIIDKLKQMSGQPIALDDLTTILEALVQVLPEDQHESRRKLMSTITQLNQFKVLGGEGLDGVISIEVGEISND